jgi:streptogramin lyase
MATGGIFNPEYTIPTLNSGAIEIVAGPDGALWLTESAANQIGRITTGGAITENDRIAPGTIYVGKRNANLILKLSNNPP